MLTHFGWLPFFTSTHTANIKIPGITWMWSLGTNDRCSSWTGLIKCINEAMNCDAWNNVLCGLSIYDHIIYRFRLLNELKNENKLIMFVYKWQMAIIWIPYIWLHMSVTSTAVGIPCRCSQDKKRISITHSRTNHLVLLQISLKIVPCQVV